MFGKLVVATHNAHKTDEIREIVGHYFESIVDLTEHPDLPEPVEDGDSFEANSAIKAFSASTRLPGTMVLADDSGLEVDALDGRPGIYSARFAGENATDSANREKLLQELTALATKGKDRSARFRCVLTLAIDTTKLAVFDGACEGLIGTKETGEGGFGYDSLFIPEGYCQSFGEIPAEEKNNISHRARALEIFSDWLESNI